MSLSPSTQTWVINGEDLGSSPCSLEFTASISHPPRSLAFACPVCGEVWARRIISPATRWFFWSICCSACHASNPNALSIPGSIWLSWDREYLLNLPVSVLKAEVLNLP